MCRVVGIKYGTTVKYLVVYLGTKFHIRVQLGKTYASLWTCRRTSNINWGFRPTVSLWLYGIAQSDEKHIDKCTVVGLIMPPLDLFVMHNTAYRPLCQRKWYQTRAKYARLGILKSRRLGCPRNII